MQNHFVLCKADVGTNKITNENSNAISLIIST